MESKHILSHVTGLRGVAILLVLFYHLQGSWCPQGYLGVDAFFVISGYFLLLPLVGKAESKQFRWKSYYAGKFTRIMPPLMVVVLLSLLVAMVMVLPLDLKNMAAGALAALSGWSNLLFGMSSVDYFAADVRENLFLHTWYIAVLLQILLVAPLLCLPLARLRVPWRMAVLGIVALASAAVFFQHWLPGIMQSALPAPLRDGGPLGSLYYLTAGRLWEVIAGAFITLLPGTSSQRSRSAIVTLGLLLLVGPAFYPEHLTGLPLLAVAGTMLIIRYGSTASCPKLLENRPLLWVGSVSYSLYLVHWPLFALVHYTQIQDFSLLEALFCLAAAFLFTGLLYHGVEKRRPGVPAAAALWLLAVGSGLTLYLTDGLRDYLHTDTKDTPEYGSLEYKDWRLAPHSAWQGTFPKLLKAHAGHCGDRVLHPFDPLYGQEPILQIGSADQKPSFVLLGDSYANALFPGLDIIGKREGWSGLYVNIYLTPFWNRLNRENGNEAYFFTPAKAEALLNWLAANPHLHSVLILQCWKWRFETAESWDGKRSDGDDAWSFNAQALRDFCKKIREIGKVPILMLPTPEARVIPHTHLGHWLQRRKLWYADPDEKLDVANIPANYEKKHGRVCRLLRELEQEGACTLIDPVPALCHNGIFQPLEDNHFIVWDHDHMTVYGACKLASRLAPQLNQLFSAAPEPRQAPTQVTIPQPRDKNALQPQEKPLTPEPLSTRK